MPFRGSHRIFSFLVPPLRVLFWGKQWKNGSQQPWTQKSLLPLLPASTPLLLCTNQFLPGAPLVMADWVLSFPSRDRNEGAFVGESSCSSRSFFHVTQLRVLGKDQLGAKIVSMLIQCKGSWEFRTESGKNRSHKYQHPKKSECWKCLKDLYVSVS